MAVVDRKISLPDDFDLKIAYIYPVTTASIGQDILDEEVNFTFPLKIAT